MNEAEKYWYSFNLDGWFNAAGRQLHTSTMEPIVRGCDYDAALAKIREQNCMLVAMERRLKDFPRGLPR
jgi:hypothetical protein